MVDVSADLDLKTWVGGLYGGYTYARTGAAQHRFIAGVGASRSQALVTSAHPGWAEGLRSQGQLFHVSDGKVHRA